MRQDMGRGTMGAVLALACLPLGGCELVDFARNPTVSFKLPRMSYAISTDDPRWKAPPAAFEKKLDCNTAADCCMPPPPGAPPELAIDCAAYTLSCDAGACGTSFPLELPITIELAKQPALMGMSSKVVSDITLQSLEYTITNNIGAAIPAVALSVAPKSVTAATGNADAKLLATLPPTTAGAMVMDTVPMSPDAKKAFQGFAKDILTPFNVIASTTVAFTSGQPLPKGKVDVVVSGTVTASF